MNKTKGDSDRIGLGDLIKEYHDHLHNEPPFINGMCRWNKEEKYLREVLNFALNFNKRHFEFGLKIKEIK